MADITEFRDRNIALLKEIDDLKAKYEGIDPEAVKADRIKLAELEKAKPHERVTELETKLAASETARLEAQKQADTFVIESKIADAFLKAGGRPEARAFIVAQSVGQFVVENGVLKGTKHSPARPGEPINVAEWLTLQTRENAFCFFPSSGGGASGSRGSGSGTGGKVIRDPTPQQLGEFAADIKAGKVRVEYSS
jgi:hypothetical protein